MSCYICDPERKHMASMRMHVDQWNEGCEDCFRDFIDAFIVPDDELPFEGGLDNTGGPATDIRVSWPASTDWEPA